eukprot:jgi/Mesvir1/6625/Mv16276-RA.1
MECLMEGCLDIAEGCYDRFKRIRCIMKHPPPEPMDIKRRYLTLRQHFHGTAMEGLVMATRERVKERVPSELGVDMDDLFRIQDRAFDAWMSKKAEREASKAAEEEYHQLDI